MSAKWPEPDEWRLSGPGSRRLRMLVYAHVGLDAYLVLAVGWLIVPRAHGFLGYLLHGVFLGQVLLLSIWAGMVRAANGRCWQSPTAACTSGG